MIPVPSLNSNPKVKYFPAQEKTAAKILSNFLDSNHKYTLLNAKTGYGKTFIVGAVIKELYAYEFFNHPDYWIGPDVVWLTAKTAIIQTERVLSDCFGLSSKLGTKLLVLNYENLRSIDKCSSWIEKLEDIFEGKPRVRYRWKFGNWPKLIIFDEGQKAKNLDATQSKICLAYASLNELPENIFGTYMLDCSATRGSKVSDFGVAIVGAGLELVDPLSRVTKTNSENYKKVLQKITWPNDPNDYLVSSMAKFLKVFDKYIVNVDDIETKHQSHIKVQWINFKSEEHRNFYTTAYERYLMEREGEGAEIVALLKFQQAAELLKMEQIAEESYEAVKQGKSAVVGVQFKESAVLAVTHLWKKLGVSLDNISLIWGGVNKARLELVAQKETLRAKMSEEDRLLLEKFGLTEKAAQYFSPIFDADSEIRDRFFKLQTFEERQQAIDEFQEDRRHFCFYTAKAGGVALSLHAWKPNSRPREGILPALWSDHQVVQLCGRAHRLTSTSDTFTRMLCYEGTIERAVAGVFSKKMRGLGMLSQSREPWMDLAQGGVKIIEDYETIQEIEEEEY